MKRIGKIILCLVVLLSFSTFVYADCNNEELNEWATKVESKLINITEDGVEAADYAYLLSINPLRDDITIKVYDGEGNSAEGRMIQVSSDNKSIYAVGCYTNLEEETYTIEVYGGEKSACPNQLLKKLTHTVPRFNRYVKDARCENSDSELCQTYTNITKDMTYNEFDKALNKEMGITENDSFFSKILNVIVDYGLYVLIPLIIVSVIYAVKIGKYKKEERNR